MARVTRGAFVALGLAGVLSWAVAGETSSVVTAPDGVELAVQESGNPAGTSISWAMTRTVPWMTMSAAAGLRKHVRALMLYGEKDNVVRVQTSIAGANELNPNVQTMLHENSGHAPFAEEPKRFNHDLASFVDASVAAKRVSQQ